MCRLSHTLLLGLDHLALQFFTLHRLLNISFDLIYKGLCIDLLYL